MFKRRCQHLNRHSLNSHELKNLQLKAKALSGVWMDLQNTVSIQYHADRGIPCDSLYVTFLPDKTPPEYLELQAFLDGVLFFDGIVDRQIFSFSAQSRQTSLECRSRIALMLDNEIKPSFYFQMTSEELIRKYALPFGAAGADFPAAKQNFLQIRKGESCWHIVEEFCELAYRKKPHATRGNRLTLSSFNSKTLFFANGQAQALPFSALTVKRQNDKRISRVYMKTATETYGYYYGAVFDNPDAAARRITRERYLHPESLLPAQKEREAKALLQKSNQDSFSVELMLPYLSDIETGDRVRVAGTDFSHDTLYVDGIECRVSPTQGILTKLTLREQAN